MNHSLNEIIEYVADSARVRLGVGEDFRAFTNMVTGKKMLLNMRYIDEIAPHESEEGTMLWSTKPGVKGYHVKEEFTYE